MFVFFLFLSLESEEMFLRYLLCFSALFQLCFDPFFLCSGLVFFLSEITQKKVQSLTFLFLVTTLDQEFWHGLIVKRLCYTDELFMNTSFQNLVHLFLRVSFPKHLFQSRFHPDPLSVEILDTGPDPRADGFGLPKPVLNFASQIGLLHLTSYAN